MRKLLKYILLTVNLAVVLALILVKLGSVINPNTWVFPSYFSLALLPIIILNVIFIIFWLVFRKWYFIISLTSLIIFGSIVKSAIVIPLREDEVDSAEQKITILSYNTMNTGLLKKHTPEHKNPVIDYVINSDADIVCLQEFAYSLNENQFTESDMERIFAKYPHKHISFQKSKWKMNIGVATFSKYPIIEKRTVDYEATFNISIFSDIKIGNDTIRVINNHLESNRITNKDIIETSELKHNFNSEKLSELTKSFSRKMSVAYRVRADQAAAVANVRDNSPYKIISCGDFNDVPSSYTYSKMKGYLTDAFKQAGRGTGWTYEKSMYGFRIDYILYDPSFKAINYKKESIKGSDHYPIQVDLFLSKK